MNHRRDANFWECHKALPGKIKPLADRCFAFLEENPRHPSLRLKRAGKLWSMRIGRSYRALGDPETKNDIFWFWIGSHDEYKKIVRRRG